LFLAASPCTLHDNIIEGKHYLTAVANKLTHIIFAIVRDNKDYVPMA